MTKIIQQEITKKSQGVLFLKIFVGESGHKLKTTVYSDSYKFQCYAKIEVFNPQTLSWNNLTYIPYGEMKTPDKLIYQPDIRGVEKIPTSFASHFRSDVKLLEKLANEILT